MLRRGELLRWCPLFLSCGAVSWIWWRGIYWPIASTVNQFMWWRGWGAHRWRVRPGDDVLMHGVELETVRAVDYRKATVTTDSGTHGLVQCCDPVDAL